MRVDTRTLKNYEHCGCFPSPVVRFSIAVLQYCGYCDNPIFSDSELSFICVKMMFSDGHFLVKVLWRNAL